MLQEVNNEGWVVVYAPRRVTWGDVHDARTLGTWAQVQSQLDVDVPRLRARVGEAERALTCADLVKQLRCECNGNEMMARHAAALVTQGALMPVYKRLCAEFPPPLMVVSGDGSVPHHVRIKGGRAPRITHTRILQLARLCADNELVREAKLCVNVHFDVATQSLALVRGRCVAQ